MTKSSAYHAIEGCFVPANDEIEHFADIQTIENYAFSHEKRKYYHSDVATDLQSRVFGRKNKT